MENIKYKTLVKLMQEKGVTTKDLAKTINVSEDTIVSQLSGEDTLYALDAHKITQVHFPDMLTDEVFNLENKSDLKKSIHELDSSLGAILCNIESLRAVHTEMGHIREDVDNADNTNLEVLGLTMRDISHKIVMVDDLLRYTLNELNDNYSKSEQIKSIMFNEIVRKEG